MIRPARAGGTTPERGPHSNGAGRAQARPAPLRSMGRNDLLFLSFP